LAHDIHSVIGNHEGMLLQMIDGLSHLTEDQWYDLLSASKFPPEFANVYHATSHGSQWFINLATSGDVRTIYTLAKKISSDKPLYITVDTIHGPVHIAHARNVYNTEDLLNISPDEKIDYIAEAWDNTINLTMWDRSATAIVARATKTPSSLFASLVGQRTPQQNWTFVGHEPISDVTVGMSHICIDTGCGKVDLHNNRLTLLNITEYIGELNEQRY